MTGEKYTFLDGFESIVLSPKTENRKIHVLVAFQYVQCSCLKFSTFGVRRLTSEHCNENLLHRADS